MEELSLFEIKIKNFEFNEQDSFLINVEDITKSHQMRDLKENSEYKTRLMSSFSHELRTPLNGAIPPLE